MATRLEYRRLPSLARLYAQGAVKRRKPPSLPFEPRIPAMEARADHVSVHLGQLARYREVCFWPEDGRLPIAFPHVLATPLHAALVMHDSFPYPILGIVHVRQTMVQHVDLPERASWSLYCRFASERPTRRGVEFDTVTEVRLRGDLLWESVATALVRGASFDTGAVRSRFEERSSVEDGMATVRERWEVPADMGRRYARVTRDFNPIHLWPWTARPFGFRRPIVHGMWSVARCLAAVHHELPRCPRRIDVRFRRPILLPARVELGWAATADSLSFSLMDRDGDDVHLDATVVAL